MKKDEKGYAAVHQSGRQHFQGGLEGTCQQGITFAQNDLISKYQQLEVNRPFNFTSRKNLTPSFWGSRRRRSSSSSSSSSSSHKKRRRKSKASKDDRGREKSRSKRRRRWIVVPRVPVVEIVHLGSRSTAKHMTCIPFYLYRNLDQLERTWNLSYVPKSEPKIRCPSGSFAAGRGGWKAVAGGWKVDGRRKKKIQRRRLRKKDENMRPGPWEVGGNFFLGGYTECHWCTFSVLPGCDDMIWAEL